jgi:hypothetical protein
MLVIQNFVSIISELWNGSFLGYLRSGLKTANLEVANAEVTF